MLSIENEKVSRGVRAREGDRQTKREQDTEKERHRREGWIERERERD